MPGMDTTPSQSTQMTSASQPLLHLKADTAIIGFLLLSHLLLILLKSFPHTLSRPLHQTTSTTWVPLHYVVAADCYSNWPVVESATDGAKGLISVLRRIFVTFGISEELSSDGGSEYKAIATQTFLKNWGVNHRLSSVAFANSNSRAEIAVKTVKRLIMDNTGHGGTLDIEKFQHAMLQYRNTSDRDTGLSPAMCVFGRSMRDFIPIYPGKYLPHPTWRETLTARDEALRNRHQKISETF